MFRPSHQILDCSQYRKAFVAGDIHGEFLKFDRALYDAGFDPNKDVVISVGDIVDRGPRSEDFEYYLSKPWFKRVFGTHEDMVREYLLGYETRENVIANGGAWYVDKPREEIERIATLLEDAPLAMTVITPGGKQIGITHADTHCDWDRLKLQINAPECEREIINLLVNSREKINLVKTGLEELEKTDNATWFSNMNFDVETVRSFLLHEGEMQVFGIDHVFHGHTPVDKPLTVANRTWTDTDRGEEGGQLTILDIDAFLK